MPHGFNRVCCIIAGLIVPATAAAQDSAGPPDPAPLAPTITVDAALIVDALTTLGTRERASGIAARGSVGATLDGARLGLPGLVANATVAAFWGPGISDPLGDVQGVSSIAAPRMVRPVNAWVQWSGPHIAVKAGIIDTNADFDEQNTGALFLNASAGMGAELAAAGLNGSGQAPFSALGVIGFVSDNHAGVKLRVGVFAGQNGDPDNPQRLVWRLGGNAGAIVLTEIDRQKPGWRIALGGWSHTAPLPRVDGTGTTPGTSGLFVTSEKLLAGRLASNDAPGAFHLDGWVRYGRAFGPAAAISSYLGGGLVAYDPAPMLTGDTLGLSLSRAAMAPSPDTPSCAESVIEASWQHRANAHVLIQPDLQWITHPGADTTRPDALIIGLRLTILH